MLWEHEPQASVSTAFSSSPNFHECFYNSIGTRRTCFLFSISFRKYRDEENEKQLRSSCASSVFLSSYRHGFKPVGVRICFGLFSNIISMPLEGVSILIKS